MRLGDVATAVASLFLVTVVISYPLEIALTSALGLHSGPPIGASISVLLGALIVGYAFSRRVAPGRKESIAKIALFFTVLMIFLLVLNNAVLGADFTDWVHESYHASHPTASPTTFEWLLVGGLLIGSQMFMNAIVLFLLSLLGLFAGSMLRTSKKTAE